MSKTSSITFDVPPNTQRLTIEFEGEIKSIIATINQYKKVTTKESRERAKEILEELRALDLVMVSWYDREKSNIRKDETMAVNVGDVFQDKDSRRKNRKVEVTFIEGEYVTVLDQDKGTSSDIKVKRLEKRFKKVSDKSTHSEVQARSQADMRSRLASLNDEDDQTLTQDETETLEAALASLGYVQLPSEDALVDRTMKALTERGQINNVRDIVQVVLDQIK